MGKEDISVIFTPDNEPYLGRKLLLHFDQIISAALEQNSKIAFNVHERELSDQQEMARIIIPQSFSLMLSIRELVRQGYLFGAKVLTRAFVERAAILLYIYHYPDEIIRWNRGWNYRDAPSLSKMFEAINKKNTIRVSYDVNALTASMNSLLHAKPDSAYVNLVDMGKGEIGFSASKILNNPKLCDDICADLIPWIAVVQAMMIYFFKDS